MTPADFLDKILRGEAVNGMEPIATRCAGKETRDSFVSDSGCA
jgi:hypothetical protein